MNTFIAVDIADNILGVGAVLILQLAIVILIVFQTLLVTVIYLDFAPDGDVQLCPGRSLKLDIFSSASWPVFVVT